MKRLVFIALILSLAAPQASWADGTPPPDGASSPEASVSNPSPTPPAEIWLVIQSGWPHRDPSLLQRLNPLNWGVRKFLCAAVVAAASYTSGMYYYHHVVVPRMAANEIARLDSSVEMVNAARLTGDRLADISLPHPQPFAEIDETNIRFPLSNLVIPKENLFRFANKSSAEIEATLRLENVDAEFRDLRIPEAENRAALLFGYLARICQSYEKSRRVLIRGTPVSPIEFSADRSHVLAQTLGRPNPAATSRQKELAHLQALRLHYFDSYVQYVDMRTSLEATMILLQSARELNLNDDAQNFLKSLTKKWLKEFAKLETFKLLQTSDLPDFLERRGNSMTREEAYEVINWDEMISRIEGLVNLAKYFLGNQLPPRAMPLHKVVPPRRIEVEIGPGIDV